VQVGLGEHVGCGEHVGFGEGVGVGYTHLLFVHVPPGQSELLLQQPAICECAQPVGALQESAVQMFPSSHETGECAHPLTESQDSAVHRLLSSQLVAVLKSQPLAGKQLLTVHALLSSQVVAVLKSQPVAGRQLLTVHLLLSSQVIAVFEHWPVLHESVVHALLSLQSGFVLQRTQFVAPSHLFGALQAVPQAEVSPEAVFMQRPVSQDAQSPKPASQDWQVPHATVVGGSSMHKP
jgi:hypothetical protein